MRLVVLLVCACFVSLLRAEDGSRLWLRMERNADAAEVRVERGTKRTATVDIAVRELEDYWKGDGKVVLRVAEDGPARDGFSIGRTEKEEMVLTSASGQGLLYAAYGLLRMQQVGDTLGVGLEGMSQYRYMTARTVANSINRDRNFITLNRGLMHGVMTDMAVITPDGAMVGYVVGCSERYSVVLPLLNTDFRTSGKIVGDDHFGSISWSGASPYEVDMTELSKYAEIEVGAEVVSSGLSHYFPADVKIGYVESFELNDSQTAYDVKIRLAADMTRLGNVILIENMDFGEMSTLEGEAESGQSAGMEMQP